MQRAPGARSDWMSTSMATTARRWLQQQLQCYQILCACLAYDFACVISSALGVACAAVVWVLLQVSLLASGRLMYHGSCTDMIPWFQTLGYTYTRGALILQTRLLRSACIHSCWCQPGRLHCSVPHEGSVKTEKVDVQCLITPGRRRE
jgi:hypothetical protein